MGRLWKVQPGRSALFEVCLLFLPAIPAYLWMWPNLEGNPLRTADVITHMYVLAGTLFIGLRRWNADALGINMRGIWLSLLSGGVVILGRTLVILSITWRLALPQYTPAGLLLDLIYYFAMIGLVQELLFRGLVYRAFEDWLGTRWAIWGSSIGFVLWHIFGWGPLVGAAMLLYGLVFALIRWRAGGIMGLVLIHGGFDFFAILLLPDIDVLALGRPEMVSPPAMILGLLLIVLTPVVLWQLDRIKKLVLPPGRTRHLKTG